MNGFNVYIFQGCYYKIGKSNNISRRIEEVRKITPFGAIPIAPLKSNNPLRTERSIQWCLRDNQFIGEWFMFKSHEMDSLIEKFGFSKILATSREIIKHEIKCLHFVLNFRCSENDKNEIEEEISELNLALSLF